VSQWQSNKQINTSSSADLYLSFLIAKRNS
jgi:hypothetical protein